jgi:Mg-chelatase subunit ChlI
MNFEKQLLTTEFEDILGQSETKTQLKSALLMNRHIILVGPPGVGKTTLIKNLSKILPKKKLNDCSYHCLPEKPLCPECRKKKGKAKEYKGEELFIRIQGSPDLTAEDLIGDIDPIKAMKYGPLSLEAFTPGKIFKANNGVLFFDEVNRCSEKLQNALLQALEERKVTISSYDVDFNADFIFVGTMNPDDSSTEPLSDVFLDRFDFIYMGYPENQKTEERIVEMKGKKIIEFPNKLLSYMVEFVRDLRADENLEKVPSVRASLGLYERAQSNALLAGRKKVTLKDLGDAVNSVISHRIRLKPSIKYLKKPEDFIKEEFSKFLEKKNLSTKA